MYDVGTLSGWVMNDSTVISVTIFNTGKAAAPASVMKVYASENEFRDPLDVLIAVVNVPSIPADSFVSIVHQFVVPTNIPRYTTYIFGVLDAEKVISESDETDNEAFGLTSIDQQLSFGKLQVTSNTNGVGSWKVVGFQKNFKFNTIVEDVPKGKVGVTFSIVQGYETPADTIVEILQKKTTVLNIVYKKITTAIPEQDADMVKAAYPNPATDEFMIETSADLIADISVFDLQGKEVAAATDLNLNRAKIDVSAFQPGLYFVQVKGNHTTSTVKLVKQ